MSRIRPQLLDRLRRYAELSPDDLRLLESGGNIRRVRARTTLYFEGDMPRHTYFVVSGWACRCRLLENGRRQILDFVLPGDIVGIELAAPGIADHTFEAVSAAEMVIFPPLNFARLLEHRRALALALVGATLDDVARLRDQTMRVGRLSATERVVHLLLDLKSRLEAVGLANGGAFKLGIAQQDLADALGLSAVHVNRVMNKLKRQKLIDIDRRTISIRCVEPLAELAGYPLAQQTEVTRRKIEAV